MPSVGVGLGGFACVAMDCGVCFPPLRSENLALRHCSFSQKSLGWRGFCKTRSIIKIIDFESHGFPSSPGLPTFSVPLPTVSLSSGGLFPPTVEKYPPLRAAPPRLMPLLPRPFRLPLATTFPGPSFPIRGLRGSAVGAEPSAACGGFSEAEASLVRDMR